MSIAPDLQQLADRLGVVLDAPTSYTLQDVGRPVMPHARAPAGCPFACGRPHGEPGNSCPVRIVTIKEAFAGIDLPRWHPAYHRTTSNHQEG